MLIWNYVVLVFWIDGLVLRMDVDLLCRELDASKVLEQVGVMR